MSDKFSLSLWEKVSFINDDEDWDEPPPIDDTFSEDWDEPPPVDSTDGDNISEPPPPLEWDNIEDDWDDPPPLTMQDWTEMSLSEVPGRQEIEEWSDPPPEMCEDWEEPPPPSDDDDDRTAEPECPPPTLIVSEDWDEPPPEYTMDGVSAWTLLPPSPTAPHAAHPPSPTTSSPTHSRPPPPRLCNRDFCNPVNAQHMSPPPTHNTMSDGWSYQDTDYTEKATRACVGEDKGLSQSCGSACIPQVNVDMNTDVFTSVGYEEAQRTLDNPTLPPSSPMPPEPRSSGYGADACVSACPTTIVDPISHTHHTECVERHSPALVITDTTSHPEATNTLVTLPTAPCTAPQPNQTQVSRVEPPPSPLLVEKQLSPHIEPPEQPRHTRPPPPPPPPLPPLPLRLATSPAVVTTAPPPPPPSPRPTFLSVPPGPLSLTTPDEPSSVKAIRQDLPTESPPAPVDCQSGCGEKVAISQHPQFSKYFRMLKMGLPKGAVKNKMTQDGVNAAIIDKDPSEMVPEDFTASILALPTPSQPVSVKPTPRKRLQVRGSLCVQEGSVWEGEGTGEEGTPVGDIELDVCELNRMFAYKKSSSTHTPSHPSTYAATRSTTLTLLDAKRSQNGCIALARVRVPFDEIRKKIAQMEVTDFTSNQVISLQEFLPTSSERNMLSKYTGPVASLGVVEKYMLEMMKLPQAHCMLSNMSYRMQFNDRRDGLQGSIDLVCQACTELMQSVRLKKLLKVILRVTNQLNAGHEPVRGITLDSLLKLRQLKAADRKTSVLQYVFQLLQRHDATCLEFFDDLCSLGGAAKLSSVEGLNDELHTMQKEHAKVVEAMRRLAEEMRRDGQQESADAGEAGMDIEAGVIQMNTFMAEAAVALSTLSEAHCGCRDLYRQTLVYFAEEPSVSSQDFFATFVGFILACKEEIRQLPKAKRHSVSISSPSTRVEDG